MSMNLMWTCTACGGDRVYRDAWASVNDPEDIQIFDQFYCMDCEGECSIEQNPRSPKHTVTKES